MTMLATRLFLAAGFAVAAVTGHAATLGLETGSPVLTATGDAFYVPGTDLSFVGITGDGGDVSGVAALSLAGGLDPEAAPGAFLVGSAFSGTIEAIGFEIDGGSEGGDTIELLLTVSGGDLAETFGARALAVLTGEFGSGDDFAGSEFFSPATVTISSVTAPTLTPIPLPAGGLLLASGLAVLGLRRRRGR